MPNPQQEQKGLPGLLAIRERLKISQARLAAMCNEKGRNEDSIRHIETGVSDCSQQLQRELARALCCTVADLHEAPNDNPAKQLERENRLKQIQLAYKRRELELLEASEKVEGVA